MRIIHAWQKRKDKVKATKTYNDAYSFEIQNSCFCKQSSTSTLIWEPTKKILIAKKDDRNNGKNKGFSHIGYSRKKRWL